MTDLKGKKVIVRGIQSGVYFGTLVDKNGQEVELHDCRNIWFWKGAANLNQIAVEGLKELNKSKISIAVDVMVLTDVCEIILLSEEAISNLERAKIWKI